jgi:hypothetical protein
VLGGIPKDQSLHPGDTKTYTTKPWFLMGKTYGGMDESENDWFKILV